MSGATGLFGIPDPTQPWAGSMPAPQMPQPDQAQQAALTAAGGNSMANKFSTQQITGGGGGGEGISGSGLGSTIGGLAGAAFGPLGMLGGSALGGMIGGLFANGGKASEQAPGAIGVLPSEPHGLVSGNGDGRSDHVEALLSSDEYVLPSDVVSALGRGSSRAGADLLDRWVLQTRHANINRLGALPPPAKD